MVCQSAGAHWFPGCLGRPGHVQLLQRVYGPGSAHLPSAGAASACGADWLQGPPQGSWHVHDVWQHQGREIRARTHHEARHHVSHGSW